MKKALMIIGGILILLYIAAIFVPFDPEERQPGTGLSGELADPQDTDWSFLDPKGNRMYVETRSLYLIPHSITVNGWVTDGVLYVGCRNCDEKYWPKNVARDQRVRLKAQGKIYERTAIRMDNDGRTVFRMDPR